MLKMEKSKRENETSSNKSSKRYEEEFGFIKTHNFRTVGAI